MELAACEELGDLQCGFRGLRSRRETPTSWILGVSALWVTRFPYGESPQRSIQGIKQMAVLWWLVFLSGSTEELFRVLGVVPHLLAILTEIAGESINIVPLNMRVRLAPFTLH
jgi:hypothetical protein